MTWKNMQRDLDIMRKPLKKKIHGPHTDEEGQLKTSA